MSAMSSRMGGHAWVVWTTLLSFVLGALLAASLKTHQRIERDFGVSTTRLPALAQRLRSQEQANRELQNEISDLRAQAALYEKRFTEGTSASKELYKQMQDLKFLTGLTSAEGPGVRVVLRDAKERPPAGSAPEVIQACMVHDSDIRNVVNELRGAGAEVVAVNGQRLIARSAIRCVGNSTMVNDTKVAAPFKIEAIGDPETLENALKMPGGVAEELGILDMIEIERVEHISIKPYNGPMRFKYAQPVKENGST